MGESYPVSPDFKGIPIPNEHEYNSLLRLAGLLEDDPNDKAHDWSFESIYIAVTDRYGELEDFMYMDQRQAIIDALDPNEIEHGGAFMLGHAEGAEFAVAALTWIQFLRSDHDSLQAYLAANAHEIPLRTDAEISHMGRMVTGQGIVDPNVGVPDIGTVFFSMEARPLDDSKDMAFKHVADYLAASPYMGELLECHMSALDDAFDSTQMPIELYMDTFIGLRDTIHPSELVRDEDLEDFDMSVLDDDEHEYSKEAEAELAEDEPEPEDMMRQAYLMGFAHAFTQTVSLYIETKPVREIEALDWKPEPIPERELQQTFRGLPLPTELEGRDLRVLFDNETTAENSPAYSLTPEELYEQLTRLSPELERFARRDSERASRYLYELKDEDAAYMEGGVVAGHVFAGAIMTYLLWQRSGIPELEDYLHEAGPRGEVPGAPSRPKDDYGRRRVRQVHRGVTEVERVAVQDFEAPVLPKSYVVLEMTGGEYLVEASFLMGAMNLYIEQNLHALRDPTERNRHLFQAGLVHGALNLWGMFIDGFETAKLREYELDDWPDIPELLKDMSRSEDE